MKKCKKCDGLGFTVGMVEAEPGGGKQFISSAAPCRKCVKGLRRLVKRLERAHKRS